MPKPDPALLDTSRYPHTCTIEPRFGDLDVNMHVNNVALAGLLEDARIRFHRACGYRDAISGYSSMIASLAIEYLGEGHYPQALTVFNAIERLGNTSQTVVQVMIQDERLVAFARAVVVLVGKDARPALIPPAYTLAAARWQLEGVPPA